MEALSIPSYFLYPSTLLVSREPAEIVTILGSCVSVCFYDPVLKAGGMNHFMLPFWNGQGLASPKFGNIAITKLLEKMLQLGCQRENIRAKVFGGGKVIETSVSQFQIGERNIRVASEVLQELHVHITGSSLGGNQGRRIRFRTDTGEVLQKMIPEHPNRFEKLEVAS